MTKVTVVVPNYNHARFLRQRLESVFDQTFQDFEVILLDDASTDDSRAVIADYAGRPNVRCIFNDVNSGSPFAQWNRGLRAAMGEYVWIAESDDFADSQFAHTVVDVLDSHDRVGIAYSQSHLVDESGQIIGSAKDWTDTLDRNRWAANFINNGRDECGRFLCRANTIPNASAVIFRRSLYLAVGGANESMHLAADWLVWIKMLMASDVAFVAEPMNSFRRHANTVRQTTDECRKRREIFQVVSCAASYAPQIEAEAPGATTPIGPALANAWRDYACCTDQRDIEIHEHEVMRLLSVARLVLSPLDWANLLADIAFARYRIADYASVRRYLPRAVWNNPTLLSNRGVWSIALRAIAGIQFHR